jgi:hypothetical protein
MSDARLTPAESMALTVALTQAQEGRQLGDGVSFLCVLALARLDGRVDREYEPIPAAPTPREENG